MPTKTKKASPATVKWHYPADIRANMWKQFGNKMTNAERLNAARYLEIMAEALRLSVASSLQGCGEFCMTYHVHNN